MWTFGQISLFAVLIFSYLYVFVTQWCSDFTIIDYLSSLHCFSMQFCVSFLKQSLIKTIREGYELVKVKLRRCGIYKFIVDIHFQIACCKPFLGYKFIIRGNLDGKQCDDTYYQPIKFWTNGSSNCIFKKSTCNEEGQVTFNNGNGTSNRKCRCDYTAGYAFVTKPNAKCFCDPEQEDCACYLTTCKPFHLLTPGKVS